MKDYEDLGHQLEVRRGSDPEKSFLFDAEWLDITRPRADGTTWLIRQKAGAGPACSFRVTVKGRTAHTVEHPMPVSMALKIGMLMAIRDELNHLSGAIQTGAVIVEDHSVTVTEAHLAEGVRKAYGPGRARTFKRVERGRPRANPPA